MNTGVAVTGPSLAERCLGVVPARLRTPDGLTWLIVALGLALRTYNYL